MKMLYSKTFFILFLFKCHKHIACADRRAFDSCDTVYCTVGCCHYFIFHLHGFQDHQYVAFAYRLPLCYLDVKDSSRHRCCNCIASCRCWSCRCRRFHRCLSRCRSSCLWCGSRRCFRRRCRSRCATGFFYFDFVCHSVYGNIIFFHINQFLSTICMDRIYTAVDHCSVPVLRTVSELPALDTVFPGSAGPRICCF